MFSGRLKRNRRYLHHLRMKNKSPRSSALSVSSAYLLIHYFSVLRHFYSFLANYYPSECLKLPNIAIEIPKMKNNDKEMVISMLHSCLRRN